MGGRIKVEQVETSISDTPVGLCAWLRPDGFVLFVSGDHSNLGGAASLFRFPTPFRARSAETASAYLISGVWYVRQPKAGRYPERSAKTSAGRRAEESGLRLGTELG